jgi:dTDP-glucose 4,6-dehydratase
MNLDSPKTLIVTGGAGFIGSNFVEILVKRGHKVIVLDSLTYAGTPHNLEGFKGPGVCELVRGDIGDGPLVMGLLEKHRPEGLLNFAAESHVDRSISAPSAFIQTNIQGTFTLLNAAVEYWQKLDGAKKQEFTYLQISTDEVYGSLGPTGKFSEETQYQPNSPYSASKAAGDHLVRAWHHTYGLPTVTTNCSNNYGPRQFPEKLIPYMITCALSGKPLPVYGDGGNIRDWIQVQDHCEGILLALEKGRRGETYCFGGNAERNNLDVVRTICQHLDKLRPRADGKPHDSGIQFVKDRLGHDRRYAIDDSKAVQELGFKRRHNFESGLADTVRWYLENTAWVEAVLGEKLAGGKHK